MFIGLCVAFDLLIGGFMWIVFAIGSTRDALPAP